MLCATESARMCNRTVAGHTHYPDDLFAGIERSNTPETTYRKVEHRQSNAIRFEGGSWLMFRPMNKNTKRSAYEIEENGHHYLMLVDARIPYCNQFGRAIEGQTSIIVYKLKDN